LASQEGLCSMELGGINWIHLALDGDQWRRGCSCPVKWLPDDEGLFSKEFLSSNKIFFNSFHNLL
jgi:hypothetical protein